MKVTNSTSWSDRYLRRMVSWCCKQLGAPTSIVRHAVFRNSRTTLGGAARQWCSQITVCVGRAHHFPCDVGYGRGVYQDPTECLVAVTAHELFHLEAGRKGSPNYQSTRGGGTARQRAGHSSEAVTCREEARVRDLFRADRVALEAQWDEPLVVANRSAAKDPQVVKQEKLEAQLANWERKLKYAETKVRKLRRRLGVLALVAKRAQLPKAPAKPKQPAVPVRTKIATHPATAEVDDQPGDVWVHLKPGFQWSGCHSIHEPTLTAAWRVLRDEVEKCHCEDCQFPSEVKQAAETQNQPAATQLKKGVDRV